MKYKNNVMKIIYNSFIPFKGYSAMLTLFILWIRKEYKGRNDILSPEFFNHEKIHTYQQIEICALSGIIMFFLCFFTDLSWWFMLLTPTIPLLIYVLCWFIEILLPPYDKAYGNICFESEAQYNEGDLEYLGKKRKLGSFRFLKYISNKKYPYLTHKQRKELHKK